ncbi:hypothetical protein DFH07DRAFT_770230 [Mycena maculata]|uniref:Uncharacterized protein n=1 Tax=Mycena maculata TaxID=230809 RepID=A0AAD7NKK9_9AGAR|nr:hypothetical protein DFH07DRAFT_770230 [Mycena maculata]
MDTTHPEVLSPKMPYESKAIEDDDDDEVPELVDAVEDVAEAMAVVLYKTPAIVHPTRTFVCYNISVSYTVTMALEATFRLNKRRVASVSRCPCCCKSLGQQVWWANRNRGEVLRIDGEAIEGTWASLNSLQAAPKGYNLVANSSVRWPMQIVQIGTRPNVPISHMWRRDPD